MFTVAKSHKVMMKSISFQMWMNVRTTASVTRQGASVGTSMAHTAVIAGQALQKLGKTCAKVQDISMLCMNSQLCCIGAEVECFI